MSTTSRPPTRVGSDISIHGTETMETMEVADEPQAPQSKVATFRSKATSKIKKWMKPVLGVNQRVSSSTFGRIFRLKGSGHVSSSFTLMCLMSRRPLSLQLPNILMQPDEISSASFFSEIRAGITTFATMAYIIAVNVSG